MLPLVVGNLALMHHKIYRQHESSSEAHAKALQSSWHGELFKRYGTFCWLVMQTEGHQSSLPIVNCDRVITCPSVILL